MSRPDPSEQSRSRRERILDAAFHAFATRGYRDTAVDDIAGAAETSKGGIYFHFPNKEAIFRELMETTADKLVARVEKAVAQETEPVARAEAALHTVLTTFAGHRTMARLLFLDTMGAGRVFQAETNALHDRFARLIQGYLDEAVAAAVIPPIDTRIASIAWFGALNEVVARWLLADHAGPARGRLSGPARDPAAERSGWASRGSRPCRCRRSRTGRLPGAGAMTAVRPGSRTDDIGVPAMDARLAGGSPDSDGAARLRDRARWRRSTPSRCSRRPARPISRRPCGSGRRRGRPSSASGGHGRPPSRGPIASPMRSGPGASCCAPRGVDRREPRPAGRPRVHGSTPGRHRGLGRVRAGLARAPGAPRCGNADRLDPDRLGRHGDRPAVDRRWAALDRRARELDAEPQRDGRPAGRRAARRRRRAPGPRGVGPPRRPVRRRRRPRPHRQGRPGPPGRPPLAHRARRPQRAAPPRRERTREHDLRVPRDGRTFLGATPERLARTEGRSFRTMAVAGSIRRGADAAEDEALAAELLASEKDREEQAIVVDAIRDQLAPIAETLTVAPEPSVMRLRHVQHLATRDHRHPARGARPPGAGRSPPPDPGRRRRSRATSRWR